MRSKNTSIFSILLPKRIFHPGICVFRLIIHTIVLSLLIRITYTVENNVENIKTVYEKAGQSHYIDPEYTPYESKAIYTKDPGWTSLGMTPTHSFTNFLFKHLYGFDKSQPSGYIFENNGNSTDMGPKVIRNEWKDLLASNKAVILWIMLLLFLIVVIPFMATCYFCFCLCLCPSVCPPCDRRSLHKKRLIFSTLLGLLMLGILLGLIIAFLNDKLVDRGFRENSNTLRRGGADTCAFLKDVCDHVNHLFVLNFEELQTQITAKLEDAHNHIFLELTDTSGSGALVELEIILRNMNETLVLTKELKHIQNDLYFYGSQYRDSLRGIKRDLNYILTVWCSMSECTRLLREEGFLSIDTSECLHFDNLPFTERFLQGIEDIINGKLDLIPPRAIIKNYEISKMIQKSLKPVIPVITDRLENMNFELRNEAAHICNITNVAISEIYLNTLSSANHFDNVYVRYNIHRRTVSIAACLLIFLILALLVSALIFGSCVRKNNAGSQCLLIAMIAIFCVISFILVLSLFYFMLGWVMYTGACVERTDKEKFELNRQLNHSVKNMDNKPIGTHILRDFQACRADENIFDFLRKRDIYEINKLQNMKSFDFKIDDILFDENLDQWDIMSDEDFIALNNLRFGNLSNYHSILYTKHMCKDLAPKDIHRKIENVRNTVVNLFRGWNHTIQYWRPKYNTSIVNIWRLERDMANFQLFEPTIIERIDNIVELVKKIDKLITKNNLTFGDTIGEMLQGLQEAKKFMRDVGTDLINELGKNLTTSVRNDISNFKQNLIGKSNTDVGPCSPLTYIYFREVDWTCNHLVNPINGFWLGLMICGLLFLPLLYVAHRLLCLFRIIAKPRDTVFLSKERFESPTSTGAPYVPPPTLVPSGGAIDYQAPNQEPSVIKTKTD